MTMLPTDSFVVIFTKEPGIIVVDAANEKRVKELMNNFNIWYRGYQK
jgi:hypothetical protein